MPSNSLGVEGAAPCDFALVLQGKNELLRMEIDTDIEKIETSTSHLQDSLTSLSEVVLQTGEDLIFYSFNREPSMKNVTFTSIIQE